MRWWASEKVFGEKTIDEALGPRVLSCKVLLLCYRFERHVTTELGRHSFHYIVLHIHFHWRPTAHLFLTTCNLTIAFESIKWQILVIIYKTYSSQIQMCYPVHESLYLHDPRSHNHLLPKCLPNWLVLFYYYVFFV